EQRHLADARVRKRRDLGDDFTGSSAHLAAANAGNDAVRADRVAAHRDLYPGLDLPLALGRELGRESALVACPESVPRDAEPAGAEPVAQVPDRARPEGDVDERVPVED